MNQNHISLIIGAILFFGMVIWSYWINRVITHNSAILNAYREEKQRNDLAHTKTELLTKLHTFESQGTIKRDSDLYGILSDLILGRQDDCELRSFVKEVCSVAEEDYAISSGDSNA